MSRNEKETDKQDQERNEKPPCCGPEERQECCPDNDKAGPGCCGGGEKPDGMGKCFSNAGISRWSPLLWEASSCCLDTS